MNQQTLELILIIEFSLVAIIGLSFLIFHLGRESTRERIGEALVFVKSGRQLAKPVIGKKGKTSNKGISYSYTSNRVNKIILVPANYDFTSFRGRLIIFVKHTGQIIASPFAGEYQLSASEKNDLIYDILESHVGGDAMKAISGKSKAFSLLFIVIAFIIGGAAVFGFQQFQTVMKQQQQQQQVAPIPATKPLPDNIIIQ